MHVVLVHVIQFVAELFEMVLKILKWKPAFIAFMSPADICALFLNSHAFPPLLLPYQ